MMLLSTGTVYGSQYHTVEPPMWVSDWSAMELWCETSFGPIGSLWRETRNGSLVTLDRWYANNAKFWFKDPADLTLFLLKWA